jgi:hypothetical protein
MLPYGESGTGEKDPRTPTSPLEIEPRRRGDYACRTSWHEEDDVTLRDEIWRTVVHQHTVLTLRRRPSRVTRAEEDWATHTASVELSSGDERYSLNLSVHSVSEE